MKTQLTKLFITLILCLIASNAWSVCNWTGKVVRLRNGTAGTVVDIAGNVAFPNTFAFFTVPNDRYYSMLGDAESGQLTVIAQGNGASCANVNGTFFNGGTLISLDVYRNL